MSCRICGTMLDAVLVDVGLDKHPGCQEDLERQLAQRNEELKTQLLEIITWADRNSARSKQLAIGPSEIGQTCDQRMARTLAAMPQVNFRFDPWAGIVGTGIHAWMQNAVDCYLENHILENVNGQTAGLRWITETRVHADELISGCSDLYTGDVVDYKAQPLDEPVLTPNGWKVMAALSIGDEVIGSDGKPTKVIGVFPQGVKEVFKVTTRDGGSTRATAEHLWTITHWAGGKEAVGVRTTEWLKERTHRKGFTLKLPRLAPVVFESQVDLDVDPYTLGLLLGDGGMSGDSVRFTNANGLEKFLRFKVTGGNGQFNVHDAVGPMRVLGLMGKLSVNKFIPWQYLMASPEDRLALLQGLMDTDGSVHRCNAKFSTSSDFLARDVRFLVESLGGKVHDFKDSALREGATRLAHLMSIKLPAGMCPFRADIAIKKGRWAEGSHDARRVVQSVEPDGEVPTMCIAVEAEDNLYVTKNFLLTHNSAAADKIKKMSLGDISLIPMSYRVQGHIYGLGNIRAGRRVRDIVLVFLPRNGLITNMFIHREPYNELIAFKALDRMYTIVDRMNELQLPERAANWPQIAKDAGPGCWYCPFFKPGTKDDLPDATGCPGNTDANSNMEKSLKEWGGLL